MAILAAVETLHAHHGLANPVKTPIVSKALEQHFQSEAPRSWPANEKALFAALPQTIQQIIGRRERDREREVRRAQNTAAELKKQLKPDAPQEAVTTEKEKV
jgi:hypothetical protein